MRRNLLCAAVCLTLLVGAAGCRAREEPIQLVPGVTSSMLTLPNRGVEELGEGIFGIPILLTTAGRSTDIYVAQTLLRQAGIDDVLTAPNAMPKEVTSYYGALVVAVGASEKGLAAAGQTKEEELVHIQAVLDAAQERDIPVLALHIGSYSRRGELTDPLSWRRATRTASCCPSWRRTASPPTISRSPLMRSPFSSAFSSKFPQEIPDLPSPPLAAVS